MTTLMAESEEELFLLLLLSRFSRVRLCATPWTTAYQVPPSMGFSRQEYWSGVPLPSLRGTLSSSLSLLMRVKEESEKAGLNSTFSKLRLWHLVPSVQFNSVHSVVFNSLQPHELQHARPPCPSPTPGVHSDSCPLSR